MPWKHNGVTLREGRAWNQPIGDFALGDYLQHPANWASLWSTQEKADRGLEWEDPPASFDNRFYLSAGIERSLTDSSDGTIGLKTQYKNQTKETAYSLLQNTDWYVIRKYEDSTQDIPTNIANYRQAVRTAANSIETKIDAASNMTDFIKLFDSADSNGITEINRWPEEV